MDRSAPVVYVKIYPEGGKGERVDISNRVLGFTFDDDEAKADKAELEIDNYDLSIFDDPLWKKGNLMEISWGYVGNLAPARECVIGSIKGFDRLKVEALSKSILMNKKTFSRMFERRKRSDVVAEIARLNGYLPTELDIEDTIVTVPHIQQARLTDAQFIKSLAQKEGFEFYVDATGFHFHRRRLDLRPSRTFIYFTDPGQGDILSINIENDVTVTPGAVTAKGRDDKEKKTISVTGNNENSKRHALAPIAVAIDERSGVRSLAKRVAVEHTIQTNASTPALAKREADGRYIKAQQTTVLLAMNIVGDPLIGAKQVIEIQRISKRLSGKYYIKNAKHKVSPTEYTIELKCRTDGEHKADTKKAIDNKGTLNTKTQDDGLHPRKVIDADQPSGVKTLYRKGTSR